MKKQRHSYLVILVAVMIFSFITANLVTVSAAGAVSTDTIPAWKFAGGWEITSEYTSDGVLTTVPGADTVGDNAWSHRVKVPNDSVMTPAFSIADGQTVTIELSVKFYDTDGTTVSQSRNGDALDIYIKNANGDTQLGILRIWTNSGSPTNGNHSCQVMGSGWTDQGAGYWIMGDATAESKFTICFDKENFISSYVGGQTDIVPLGNAELIAERKEALKSVDAIYFEIGGDNGFTKSTEITLRSVNGQSLASTDGQFTDTVAPVFLKGSVSQTLNKGEAYTIPTKAYDLLSDVSYSLKIGDDVISGKTFTPDSVGNLNVTLVATDAAGNSSETNYTFQIVSTIEKPTITQTPAITDKTVSYFDTLILDAPQYTDDTGTGTVVLKVFSGDSEVATLSPRDDGKFVYFISSDFVSGDYGFVYEVTNSAGTVKSDRQTVTITADEVSRADFITGLNGNMLAQYLPSGIYLRSLDDWKDFKLGVFDVSEGMDAKFIVNPKVLSGATNDAACVSFLFINADDDSYRVMYRVWIDHSGADRATNVYISTDGGENYDDITDTGWISRNVDEIAGQYHMAFDIDETFIGERTGGMTRVDNAYEKLVAFFEACPSTVFEVAFQMGNLSGAKGNYEMILTELNGQSFVGEEITWEDAYLSVKTDIPEKILKGSSLSISVYAKDIRGGLMLHMLVTAPDGTTEELDFTDGTIEYTFGQLGQYSLKIFTEGSNGNEVSKTFDVVSKSAVDPIEITIDGKYQETYDQNGTLTVLPGIYSDNVVTKSITIMQPSGDSVTVSVGDKYVFAVPGVYVITYSAADDAEPTVNENSISVTINVFDTEDPKITITASDNATVGDKITSDIKVDDDSECDVTVTLVKPDGTTVKLNASDNYAFTADAVGTYTIKVTAEDLYGNKATETKTLTVAEASGDTGDKGDSAPVGVIIAIVVVSVVIVGAVVVIILKKKHIIFKKK